MLFVSYSCDGQAEKQLSSSWILMRAGNLGVPTTSEWLNGVLAPGCRIGIDPVSNMTYFLLLEYRPKSLLKANFKL